MATPTYTIVCTKKEIIAADVYEIVLTKPEGFSFKAGQFVLFDVPLVDAPVDVQPRAYSLASAPQESDLLFVIKLTPGGRMSRFITDVLVEGTELTMKGPFGFFTLRPDPKDIVFIATSTGVAPFRAQIIDALAHRDTRMMDLIYGVRSEEDLFWHKELRDIAERHSNVRLHVTLSSPSSKWQGLTGRVQPVTRALVPDFSGKHLYVCGNPDMTKEVKQLALTEWGMQKQDVHVEGYI